MVSQNLFLKVVEAGKSISADQVSFILRQPISLHAPKTATGWGGRARMERGNERERPHEHCDIS